MPCNAWTKVNRRVETVSALEEVLPGEYSNLIPFKKENSYPYFGWES